MDPAVLVAGEDLRLLESRPKSRLQCGPGMPKLVNESNDVQVILPHPYEVLDILIHLHHPGHDGCVQDGI